MSQRRLGLSIRPLPFWLLLRPFFFGAAQAAQRPGPVSVFVTYADGAVEGLPLALGILEASAGRVQVVAGINGSATTPASEQFRAAGAVLRPMLPEPDFKGVDCVF